MYAFRDRNSAASKLLTNVSMIGEMTAVYVTLVEGTSALVAKKGMVELASCGNEAHVTIGQYLAVR